MKLSWWSDVAIANVDSPDAVVHSEDERYDEMVKMGEYFRKLWDARADAAADLRPGLDAGAFAGARETCRRASSSAPSGC